jgi:hypothetical protein
MTIGPNPLHLANTAQQMARNAPKDDAVVFNKVAMICMGVMAASSVTLGSHNGFVRLIVNVDSPPLRRFASTNRPYSRRGRRERR